MFNAAGELLAICHQAAPDFGRGTYALPVEVIERVEKDLKARGRVVRSGRTLSVCSGEAHCTEAGGQKLVATMLSTVMTVQERGLSD